jgi:hypothetical protein
MAIKPVCWIVTWNHVNGYMDGTLQRRYYPAKNKPNMCNWNHYHLCSIVHKLIYYSMVCPPYNYTHFSLYNDSLIIYMLIYCLEIQQKQREIIKMILPNHNPYRVRVSRIHHYFSHSEEIRNTNVCQPRTYVLLHIACASTHMHIICYIFPHISPSSCLLDNQYPITHILLLLPWALKTRLFRVL